MLREPSRQCYLLVIAYLRDKNDTLYLLHRGVIRRRRSVHITSNLSAQIGNSYELAEDVLGQYIGESCLANVFGGNIYVVRT